MARAYGAEPKMGHAVISASYRIQKLKRMQLLIFLKRQMAPKAGLEQKT
jgi:hypothetical protein